MEKAKSEIKAIGRRMTGHKTTGMSGSGKMTLYYLTPLFRQMLKQYKDTGVDIYFDLVVENNDPSSSAGKQTTLLMDCNLDSVVLTKLDGDARGGAALSIKAVTGKPIKFVGVGEKLDQVELFYPDRMASRILGMGDVLSLIEKAQQTFDAKKAAELEQKLRKNKFTLADFYDQLVQIKGMGSLSDIAGMLPGMNAKALEGASVDENALARTEAIIPVP